MARDSKMMGVLREPSAEVSTGLERTGDSCGSGDEDELTPTNLTVWREAFSLRSFLPQICKEMRRRAPFLMGSEQAQYTRSFFADVGGLCNEGIPFRKLKYDHGITLEELSHKYPLNRRRNRHPMKLMENVVNVWNVQCMHQKVYGGCGPDNGEYGTAFLRGVELEFRHKKKVNWAEGAAELALQRMKNSGQNPQKMTPPCIRQQIQGLLDLFEHLLGRALMAHAAAVAQLRAAKVIVSKEAQIDREFSGVLQTHQTPMQLSSTTPKLLAGAMVDVPLQQITTPRQARSKKVDAVGQQREVSKVACLLRQKTAAELEHSKVIIALEHAQVDLSDKQERMHEFSKTEEALWDEFAVLQSAKKQGCHDAAARLMLDNKVRALMLACGKASEVVEKNQVALIEKTKEVELLKQKVFTLGAQIQDMDGQIDIIIIEESCVRPQQFFTSFPTLPTSMTSLKEELPCGLCGRFWAEMALANLPCGCLFHPCCMFRIVLGKNPRCPSCDHVPGGVWMGQWGLVTNNATMQASIEAHRAAMDAERCAPPLSQEDAQTRIREIAILVAAQSKTKWCKRKRSAVDSECESRGGPTKLVCGNATNSRTIPTDKMEVQNEAPDVSRKLVQQWDAGNHLLSILDDEAMQSLRLDPHSSLSSTGLAIAINSTSVHDELDMELIQIAKDAAAEVEDLQACEEQEHNSYKSANAIEMVVDFAVAPVVDATDAIASIGREDGHERD